MPPVRKVWRLEIPDASLNGKEHISLSPVSLAGLVNKMDLARYLKP